LSGTRGTGVRVPWGEPWCRGEQPAERWGGPPVRGRRPRRPAGSLQDADTVVPAAGRGRPARTGGPPHQSRQSPEGTGG
jgi:hypothetical protein